MQGFHMHHRGSNHHQGGCSCCHAHSAEYGDPVVFPTGASILKIPDMDCPVEENDIRSILGKIQGIRSLHFNLAERKLAIDADTAVVQDSLVAVRKAGYQAEIHLPDGEAGARSNPEKTWPMWTSLVIACFIEVMELVFPDESLLFNIGCMALAVIAIGLAGFQTYKKGIASLLRLQLNINALIRIRPGQRIPLDGIVQEGHSLVDQSAVTGESTPVSKQYGDQVFAGTVNQNSILQVQVSSSASDTLAAGIVRTVEAARQAKAPFQQSIDRFAAIYTPMVFVIALCIAIGCPLLTEMSWPQSCYRAFAVLVIACPCALVISTPATLVSGLTAAVRKGILVKGGIFLEYARKIRLLALDKTGTVTEGKPKLQRYSILTDRYAETDILAWAAVLTSHSDHPVSKAIAQGLSKSGGICKDFIEYPGKGICATVNGLPLRLGSAAWLMEGLSLDNMVEQCLHIDTNNGYTTALLATETDILAVFAIADSIKSTSKNAVNLLNKLGIDTVLLTGDNFDTAKTIAQEAGITEIKAQLLPTEKSQAIQALKERIGKGLVAMVGDGINDAPALATADIGIAMGQAGTDIAMDAADIVIMNDDLGNIPKLIQLSKDTFCILTQNIVFALGVKVLFIVLALMGLASMWMAVFADIGTTLIVLFNGLRMLRK